MELVEEMQIDVSSSESESSSDESSSSKVSNASSDDPIGVDTPTEIRPQLPDEPEIRGQRELSLVRPELAHGVALEMEEKDICSSFSIPGDAEDTQRLLTDFSFYTEDG